MRHLSTEERHTVGCKATEQGAYTHSSQRSPPQITGPSRADTLSLLPPPAGIHALIDTMGIPKEIGPKVLAAGTAGRTRFQPAMEGGGNLTFPSFSSLSPCPTHPCRTLPEGWVGHSLGRNWVKVPRSEKVQQSPPTGGSLRCVQVENQWVAQQAGQWEPPGNISSTEHCN